MTSPSPTPGSPSPAASGSGSAPTSGSAAAPSTPISTAPPGPLSPDAQAAMQSALTAEQAAVWAYALVAAHARDQSSMVADARSGHLLRRDATAARLTAAGAAAPEPAAAYQVAVDVQDQNSAWQLAQDIESDVAAAWRVVIGSTDDAEVRGFALTGLSEAAVRLAMWKQVAGIAPPTIAFPGQN
ncbi:DUF4439 domain-containing protein [Nakamurella sp.]|uniref:DUF4439 domain-containing protein n=1 Tax=Nakamurella sp. TaxID=1869182 RepID=UPI003B3AF97F